MEFEPTPTVGGDGCGERVVALFDGPEITQDIDLGGLFESNQESFDLIEANAMEQEDKQQEISCIGVKELFADPNELLEDASELFKVTYLMMTCRMVCPMT